MPYIFLAACCLGWIPFVPLPLPHAHAFALRCHLVGRVYLHTRGPSFYHHTFAFLFGWVHYYRLPVATLVLHTHTVTTLWITAAFYRRHLPPACGFFAGSLVCCTLPPHFLHGTLTTAFPPRITATIYVLPTAHNLHRAPFRAPVDRDIKHFTYVMPHLLTFPPRIRPPPRSFFLLPSSFPHYYRCLPFAFAALPLPLRARRIRHVPRYYHIHAYARCAAARHHLATHTPRTYYLPFVDAIVLRVVVPRRAFITTAYCRCLCRNHAVKRRDLLTGLLPFTACLYLPCRACHRFRHRFLPPLRLRATTPPPPHPTVGLRLPLT